MKNYMQKGSRLEYTATTDITSGTCLAVGDRVGIACADISTGATGVLVMEGVFELPKLSTDDIGQGVVVYFDANAGNITLSGTGNTCAGFAFTAAGTGTTTVQVKINAQPKF